MFVKHAGRGGRYEPAVGHYVKYEKDSAPLAVMRPLFAAPLIRKKAVEAIQSCVGGFSLGFLPRRVQYVCETGYMKVQSALWRPGRLRT